MDIFPTRVLSAVVGRRFLRRLAAALHSLLTTVLLLVMNPQVHTLSSLLLPERPAWVPSVWSGWLEGPCHRERSGTTTDRCR